MVLVDSARSFADGRPCRVARSADEAIAILRLHEFDVIEQLWLEHDLGWRRDASPLTTMPVVEELVSAAGYGRPYAINEIRIHTRNAAGASAMKIALADAGYRIVRHYDPRTLRL